MLKRLRAPPSPPWAMEGGDKPPNALEYICIATDLVQQMFATLQSLSRSDPALARVLSNREALLRHRLWTLGATVDLLVNVVTEIENVPLMRRATSLISWLSGEIDNLALLATDNDSSMSPCGTAIH
jgi:hypothetical protein